MTRAFLATAHEHDIIPQVKVDSSNEFRRLLDLRKLVHLAQKQDTLVVPRSKGVACLTRSTAFPAFKYLRIRIRVERCREVIQRFRLEKIEIKAPELSSRQPSP